jgi:hypothetical protein
MKLYHYTSRWHLPHILKTGLSIGDVPTTPTGGFNAVWLTDRKTDKLRWAALEFCSVNKTEVLLEVELEPSDKLVTWAEVCITHEVEKSWAKALSHGCDSAHWYLYLGTISADLITIIKQPNESFFNETNKN